MPVAYPKPGEFVRFDDMPLGLRASLLIAAPGAIIAGLAAERGTLELYRVIIGGQSGTCEFLGYLAPEPLPLRQP